MDERRITTLIWGVKESFRRYVEGAGGVIEVAAGAERAPDGAIAFAADADHLTLGADGKLEGRGAFLGEVRFEAHGGMLAVRLIDPSIEIGPTGATITAADTPARDYRVEVARLDLNAAELNAAGELVVPAALAIDGSHLLGGHYPPSTPLDPVRLTLAK